MSLRLPADIFIAPSFPPSSAKCCHDTLPRRPSPSRSRKRLWAPRLSASRIHHQGEAAGALFETPWPLLGCPALPTNLASLRRRQPIKPAPLPVPWLRGSAPVVQGALSLALDCSRRLACSCSFGMPLWLSLEESGRPWSMQGTNLVQHGIHASGLVAAICRRQPTNLEVVCSVSHSAARRMLDGCHWDNFFTFSLGRGDGAARQLPVFPPSSTP